MWKKIAAVFLGLTAVVVPALAHLNVDRPTGSIVYPGGTFTKVPTGGVLQSVAPGDTTHWFLHTTTGINSIIGYAHLGQAGLAQSDADARVALIQIWGWKDTDGDGQATINDSRVGTHTTKWVLLSQIKPSTGHGHVIGYNTDDPVGTAAWADILQVGSGNGTAITLQPGDSWLLLLRVVDIVGNTNLQAVPGGVEQWDDGDTSNGVGSDVPADKYIAYNGMTPGTSTQKIDSRNLVWVYVPKT